MEALKAPPPDGGLWTGPKLRAWVERELGKKVSLYPIYRLLHEMGFTLQVPALSTGRGMSRCRRSSKKNSLERLKKPRGRFGG